MNFIGGNKVIRGPAPIKSPEFAGVDVFEANRTVGEIVSLLTSSANYSFT